MPTAVHCMVETDRPYALVRVSGALDLAGSVAIRSAVLKCLVEQPEAVLVDLGRMRVADPTALSVFVAMARQAAMWPAIPLMLCGPRPEAAALLRARALDRQMPVLPSVADAVRRLGDGDRAPSIIDELLPVVGAGRRARELVTDACARWSMAELAGSASTVVTELVNNGVVHAHTMMTLHLSRRGQLLHVAVRDGSPEPPVLHRDIPLTASTGRGLALVAALSRRWGSLPTEGGKVVWAVLG